MSRYANALQSAAQYRIDPNDATRIQVKPGPRKHWIQHGRYQGGAGYTAEQMALAVLRQLTTRQHGDR